MYIVYLKLLDFPLHLFSWFHSPPSNHPTIQKHPTTIASVNLVAARCDIDTLALGYKNIREKGVVWSYAQLYLYIMSFLQ